MPIVLKSLEPQLPVQAYTRIALIFTFTYVCVRESAFYDRRSLTQKNPKNSNMSSQYVAPLFSLGTIPGSDLSLQTGYHEGFLCPPCCRGFFKLSFKYIVYNEGCVGLKNYIHCLSNLVVANCFNTDHYHAARVPHVAGANNW